MKEVKANVRKKIGVKNVKEKEEVSVVNFKDYFYYDETSVTCLRRVNDLYVGRRLCSLKKKKGSVVGCLTFHNNGLPASGHCYIKGVRFKIHRVIWELLVGPIPDGYIIDHLDGNPHNNKIENLACKTLKQNAQNCAKRKHNTSGITGVRRVKPTAFSGWYWQAKVNINNKSKVKSFSVATYGEDGARKLATEWRELQLKILNENGESYTERHGK